MEEINKAYATFEERDRIASLGGGVDKIEKQHESGKMTARERIETIIHLARKNREADLQKTTCRFSYYILKFRK